MKLSEAMRKGAEVLKPAPCALVKNGCGCALGMALVGVGAVAPTFQPDSKGANEQSLYDKLVELWPWLGIRDAKDEQPYMNIAVKFDREVCPREDPGIPVEDFIQWVESIEPQEQENN